MKRNQCELEVVVVGVWEWRGICVAEGTWDPAEHLAHKGAMGEGIVVEELGEVY